MMKICKTCLLDESISDVVINDEGRCQYCLEAEIKIPQFSYTDEQVEKNLSDLSLKIKSSGKYDCLIGISGGVDSSYVTYLAHQKLKVNPLVIHFDNGWNSETANRNIQKIVSKAGFDFQTYVIDWHEFRDLQRSFFLADVLDIEMLTDHAIYAAMFKLAKKHGIRHVLSGSNYRTEHGLPGSWSWIKQDFKNIKAIHKLYGSKKLKSFPVMGITKYGLIRAFKLGATFHKPLDLINYKKDQAMETLKSEYGWEYYGGKHYESVFTKFYQAHYLPTKFGIDKRRAHLSSSFEMEKSAEKKV